MSTISAFVLRHKRLVIAGWILLAVVGFATLSSTTKRLSSEFKMPGEPSYVAGQKIQAVYHSGGNSSDPVVVTVTAPPGQVANPVTADRVFYAAAAAEPGSRVVDQLNTKDAAFSTQGGQTSFGILYLPPSTAKGFGDNTTRAITTAAERATPSGWTAGVTGLDQLETGGSQKGNSAFTEVLLGGIGALAVLAFVFGSFIAFVPLLMAIIAIPTTFLFVNGLTRLTSVSIIVEFLVALIGLGVAIDYALLVVTRWREERAHGRSDDEAVVLAMQTAGRSVVFSGLTVAVSLLALAVLPVSFLRNIGAAGFLIPIVSVAVAITLLPAFLATVGPWMDRPRVRHEANASRPWTAWARLVLRHRYVAAIGGTALIVALILPVFALNLGEPVSSTLAQRGPAHAALTTLERGGVPSGVIEPMEVLVQDGQQARVAARLASVKGVYTAAAPLSPSFAQKGTALVEVLPEAEQSTAAGGATISAVRSAARDLPGVIGVNGMGPGEVDFIHAVYGSFPLMLSLIALATLVLLTRAFRSVVLAAKAVIFNGLSVAASFGVMVLVWQQGHGSNTIWGIPATGAISTWVPIMVFAFLFGLSMDYEVFILTRIREEYDRTGSTDAAVVGGVGRTGRLVTGAALILFMSFLSLSTAGMTDLKVMATGLGMGILLDAVVVRSLLVPALVGVLGRWNWYLPSWLGRALWVRKPQPAVAS
jgi:RND superfamily putative drug exporter